MTVHKRSELEKFRYVVIHEKKSKNPRLFLLLLDNLKKENAAAQILDRTVIKSLNRTCAKHYLLP